MEASGCPSDERLLAFAEGLIDAGARDRLEGHLAACSSCTAVLGAAYDGTHDELESVGRYRVVREVGRGGMGRVLEATDPVLGRTVAIKLILPDVLSERARARFVREAVALGKLRHPNVIEVFDLGVSEGTPYFVMEFVDGANLDQWCRGKEPSEIVACLLGAGRGLAAAHRAGIMHRDFKPSNVIVGPDGRARVGDFGLAGLDPVTSSPDGGGADSLTRTGALMGTLPYMAPELLEGAKASPASDQYAFCVASFEVLYGQRPFVGSDARELSAAIRMGEVTLPSSGSSVPRRMYDVLTRGLSRAPADRYPSMRALLRALGGERRSGSTSVVVGLGVVGLVAGAVVLRSDAPPACSGVLSELAAAYGPTPRLEIRAAFAKQSHAGPTVRSTLESLDAYADLWRTGVRSACASAERGDLTDGEFDRRLRCYRHAVQGLAATVDVLRSATGSELLGRSGAGGSLPELSTCADDEALARLPVLPDDVEQAAEVAALEPVLSRLEALAAIEDVEAMRELLDEHTDELDDASYPPVRVRVLLAKGWLALTQGQTPQARGMLLEAHEVAVEHGLDRAASRTATLLGRVAGRFGSKEKPERWFDMALAIAEARGFRRLQADALVELSRYRGVNDDLAGAVEAAGRAVALVEDDETVPRAIKAETYRVYADWAFNHAGGDAGLVELERAHEILLALHGDTHRAVARVERSLQVRAARRGDFVAAYRHAREALRIAEIVHGKRSNVTTVALMNLSISLKDLGRFDEAIAELDRAEGLLDELGAVWPEMRVAILLNRANALLRAERTDEAARALVRARTLIDSRIERKEERRVAVLAMLALVAIRDGDVDAARRLATDALEASQEVYGAEHAQTADVLARLGHVELEAGRYALARGLLERSLHEDRPEGDRAWAKFLLARAVLEDPEVTPAAREEALESAREAEAVLVDLPVYQSVLAELRAWLHTRAEP